MTGATAVALLVVMGCLFLLSTGGSAVKMVEEAGSDIMAARERMIARRFGGANATRTGGVRRKKKNVHKTATSGTVCGVVSWVSCLVYAVNVVSRVHCQ